MSAIEVSNNSLDQEYAESIVLEGYAQGIGMRPFVVRLAKQYRLSGWVRNSNRGVDIHVEGNVVVIEQFKKSLEQGLVNLGSVHISQTNTVPFQGLSEFQIYPSIKEDRLNVLLPVDRVTCRKCMAEYSQETDRRFRYPLIACSQCGPRYSLIYEMPFERRRTAMDVYELCTSCEQEYRNIHDRRFHSQTIACSVCGPRVIGLEKAINSLSQGGLVGLRGLGGYQIIVQANHGEAIRKIRDLKKRKRKPFGIMVADIATVQRLADVDERSLKLLQSSTGPIVLLRRKNEMDVCFDLHPEIAPRCNTIGIMLPTTPIHWELVQNCGALVVTSANLEGEPIAVEREKIARPIVSAIDIWIENDRRIANAVDDSVIAVSDKAQSTVRLSRGLAPWSLDSIVQWCSNQRIPLEEVVAVGGHQKVSIAICNGRQVILGPHLGDMETEAMRARFNQHISDSLQLLETTPKYLVHDLHQDYYTSQWAEEYSTSHAVQSIAVQHHHAHIVSTMIDNRWLDRTVLGVAWDGTGLGSDGTIWGGEFLLSQAHRFERVVALRPFELVGGDTAVKEPWRIVITLLSKIGLKDKLPEDATSARVDSLTRAIRSGVNSPKTSSIGRLFDAVAVLLSPELLWGERVSYEGEFAANLETMCDERVLGEYPFPVVASELFAEDTTAVPRYWLDWEPLLRAIVQDVHSGVSRHVMAMKFHRSLVSSIIAVSSLFPGYSICLGGGVFQNRILVDLVLSHYEQSEVEIGIGSNVPMNDGGLAAGQLAIGLAVLHQERSKLKA